MTVIAQQAPASRHDGVDFGAVRERFLRRLLAGDTATAVAHAAVDAARELAGADLSWCGTVSGDFLTMAAHNGLRTTEMMAIWRLQIGQGVGGRVARDGRPLVCRDYRHDPRRVPVMKSVIDAEGLISTLVVPLLNGQEILGVLYAGQRDPRDWDPAEQESLCAIGRDAGLALARIRTQYKLEEFAEKADRARRALEVAADVATAVGSSEDVGAGLEVLALRLGRRLELVDGGSVVLRAVPSSCGSGPQHTAWLEIPIALVGFGALRVSAEPPLEPEDEDLARLGADIIGLQLRRVRAALHENTRLQGDLVSDLFDRRCTDSTAIRETAALLGLDLSAPYFVACVGVHLDASGAAADSRKLPRAPRRGGVEAAIRSRFPDLVLVSRADHTAILIPANGSPPGKIQADVRRALAGSEPPLAGGIGRMCIGLQDYVDSYLEASAALAAARRRSSPGEVLSAADVGFLGLLAHGSGTGPLEDHVADTLGPLLDSDEKTGSQYVKTLDAYLANDRHLDKTAAALSVHPNTVRYRVSKAQEKLGVDLHDVDVRFLLELALRVHAVREQDGIDGSGVGAENVIRSRREGCPA